ncbi:MAG: thioredoxin [Prevotella sp.]|jgi:thioredoxin
MIIAALFSTSCTSAKQKQQTTNKQEAKKMNTTELTLSEFKNKVMDFEKDPDNWNYKGDKPAIIDFYATWCGPCKATAPILDSLAEEYKDKIIVYKVDVDKEQELASMFGIRSIPSLLFIPMQGDPKMQVGAMGRMDLENAIKNTLLK